jgi:hypothetical protein
VIVDAEIVEHYLAIYHLGQVLHFEDVLAAFPFGLECDIREPAR